MFNLDPIMRKCEINPNGRIFCKIIGLDSKNNVRKEKVVGKLFCIKGD